MITTIAFDADDTLWHNEHLYTMTQEQFKGLLAAEDVSADAIDQKLFETETRNLAHFGYGIKGFALSMIETAVELTEGKVAGHVIGRIIEFAKAMKAAPVQLLPGVAQTVQALSQAYTLAVITKGDLFDQETKIAHSGLGDFFAYVEVVSDKTRDVYASIWEKWGVEPASVLMVGNSPRSDVLPALASGAAAVHIPYETIWAHETVHEDELDGYAYHTLTSIGELPGLLETLAAR